jgi:predicted RNA-binding protein with PUA-like domain
MTRRPQQFWLMKTEPETFSFDDLQAAPQRTSLWDGVRNYQARNFMTGSMAPGDGVLVYHSSAEPPGIAGTAVIAGVAVPDPTQFDPRSGGHDPKSSAAAPRWFAIPVRAEAPLARFLSLEELQGVAELAGMALLRPGQRLSIQPVTAAEWRAIQRLALRAAPAQVAIAKPRTKKQLKRR